MAENKTKPTKVSPAAFIAKVANEQRRKDAQELVKLFKEVTGKPPKMWGPSIVGFDQYHYVYESGREGDAPLLAFSPRKSDLVLYVMCEKGDEEIQALLAKLGKYRSSVSCLYVKQLADLDRVVLKQLMKKSMAQTRKRYP
jgi:hypothetical protein